MGNREVLEPGESIIDGSSNSNGSEWATNIVTNRGRWLQVVGTDLPGQKIFNVLEPARAGLVQVFDDVRLSP